MERGGICYDCAVLLNGKPYRDPEETGVARTGTQGLSIDKLKDLARAGAEEALRRLRAEIVAIERTFPELALPQKQRAAKSAVKEARKNTRKMSAAARNGLDPFPCTV